jgi:hypothetical protein
VSFCLEQCAYNVHSPAGAFGYEEPTLVAAMFAVNESAWLIVPLSNSVICQPQGLAPLKIFEEIALRLPSSGMRDL